jgi:hypothetical protein
MTFMQCTTLNELASHVWSCLPTNFWGLELKIPHYLLIYVVLMISLSDLIKKKNTKTDPGNLVKFRNQVHMHNHGVKLQNISLWWQLCNAPLLMSSRAICGVANPLDFEAFFSNTSPIILSLINAHHEVCCLRKLAIAASLGKNVSFRDVFALTNKFYRIQLWSDHLILNYYDQYLSEQNVT